MLECHHPVCPLLIEQHLSHSFPCSVKQFFHFLVQNDLRVGSDAAHWISATQIQLVIGIGGLPGLRLIGLQWQVTQSLCSCRGCKWDIISPYQNHYHPFAWRSSPIQTHRIYSTFRRIWQYPLFSSFDIHGNKCQTRSKVPITTTIVLFPRHSKCYSTILRVCPSKFM